jgi:hypothetical protein
VVAHDPGNDLGHQRRLAGSRHPGSGGQHAQRQVDVEVAQVDPWLPAAATAHPTGGVIGKFPSFVDLRLPIF